MSVTKSRCSSLTGFTLMGFLPSFEMFALVEKHLAFPRQMFNASKRVVAGCQGAPGRQECPRLGFEPLGGTVHGYERDALPCRGQVLVCICRFGPNPSGQLRHQ